MGRIKVKVQAQRHKGTKAQKDFNFKLLSKRESNFSKSSGISHRERHAAHLLRRVAITARAPALRERSNLLDSAEIASPACACPHADRSLALLAMTKNHSFRRLPEFIEMLQREEKKFRYGIYCKFYFLRFLRFFAAISSL